MSQRRLANRRASVPIARATAKMITATGAKTVDCGSHGSVPWTGTRPYQCTDETKPHFAPPVCACGARLMPADRDDDTFTARVCCWQCWDAVVKALDGKAASS